MIPILALVIALAAGVAIALRWRARSTLLRRLRSEWTQPRSRTHLMALIAEYHRVRVAATGPDTSLDDRTWDDLHLDALFALLDRTESTVGQQALYHRLRTAPVAADLDTFEALVTHMTVDVAVRERAQMALAYLQDPAGYQLCAFGYEDFQPQRWHAVFPVLAGGMALALLAAPFAPLALLIAILGVVVHLILRIAIAGRSGAALGLFRQIAPLIGVAEILASLQRPEFEAILAPLHEELPRLRRLRLFASWAGRNPGGDEVVGALFEYVNLVFLLDANALFFGGRELRTRADSIVRVIGAVGDLDAAIAVASFRAGTSGWTRPRFLPPEASATLTDLRHPLVVDAVPNSLALKPPHGLLLTGANMSGKSTLLRTVGVNVVLAQTINTALAAACEAPVFRVRSLMGRSDDLVAGKSYYLVEVEAIVQMLGPAETGAPHLFLLDELFRGTNTIERIAAAEAVLAHLLVDVARPGLHVVIAATHDRELVDLLQGRYAPAHLADTLGPTGLVFEYRLRPGPATTRNAIALLQLNGAPETLVGRAQSLADELDDARRTAGVPISDVRHRTPS